MKAPSLRSPKCSCSTERTCSESVPGTLKTFDCSADSLLDVQKPTTSTTSHTTTIGQRSRIAVPVQVVSKLVFAKLVLASSAWNFDPRVP